MEHESQGLRAEPDSLLEAKPDSSVTTVKKRKKKKEESDWALDPMIASDERDFEMFNEEIETAKKDFMEKLEVSEKTIEKISKLRTDYFKQTSEIYKKFPEALSFTDKRKLIDLEEKFQLSVEEAYGPKWPKYKQFVDNYNQKILERMKNGEGPSIMMPY
jgi:hypothetical protein